MNWSRTLSIAGSIAMLVGAIDPLEGSLLVLPGSGLVALGTFLGQAGRRRVAYRVSVFIMIVIGVGALWGLSMAGGFGGSPGLSLWWGTLVLPYLIGWSMGIWGPGSPRWVLWPGMVVGLWYIAILVLDLMRPAQQEVALSRVPVIVIAAIGVLTIAGCVYRLKKS